jgi:16S rRNA (uracil1498-N3)-methyltransferase
MTRIFLPPEELTSEEIIITGDNARHLALVLKIHPGEPITVFDGQGCRYDCTVMKVHKNEVIVQLMNKTPYSAESPLLITLAQSLPKGDKMDLIIQKATELGVREVIPLVTERSQVRHTHKIERWRKIALSASRQSGRDKIPEIHEPLDYKEYLNSPTGKCGNGEFTGIIFSEKHKTRNLKQVLSGFRETKPITVLVGPEGGFSKGEVSAAVEKGFIEASMGPRILRTETAPIAAISIIQYELGDLG